jgi:hypothetical protein
LFGPLIVGGAGSLKKLATIEIVNTLATSTKLICTSSPQKFSKHFHNLNIVLSKT